MIKTIKTKILSVLLLSLISFAANASETSSAKKETLWEHFERNVGDTWQSDTYDVYIPVNTWHNRSFYDSEHIDKYNEEPWGLGLGVSRYDEDGDWHGLYAMAFKDSNFYVQTIFGYAYQKNWYLNENRDLSVGAGFTLSLTQRHEYYYIPVPLPLPLVGLTYKRLSVQAAYVPGVKNDGNVLFTWLRWQIN